jgi:hypothetical protein
MVAMESNSCYKESMVGYWSLVAIENQWLTLKDTGW